MRCRGRRNIRPPVYVARVTEVRYEDIEGDAVGTVLRQVSCVGHRTEVPGPSLDRTCCLRSSPGLPDSVYAYSIAPFVSSGGVAGRRVRCHRDRPTAKTKWYTVVGCKKRGGGPRHRSLPHPRLLFFHA